MPGLIKKKMIKNKEHYVPFYIYQCERCKKEIGENFPYEEFNGNIYCEDCAFILGLIDDKTYIKNELYFYDDSKISAVVRENKIHIFCGKFPWERTTRDRSCKEYTNWRKCVFDRDNYTCQKCGQIGGTLNAHHIKHYKDYPKLRYELSNGVTLCEKCHRELHKKERSDSIGKFHKD